MTDTIDTLRAENDRLTTCLEKANASAEHFEREWYLRGDELDTLRAQLAEAHAALKTVMRNAELSKEPCGPDPESPAAVRNAKFASLSSIAAQGLGMVSGPSLTAQLAEAQRDAGRLDYIQKHARCDPQMDGNHVWWPTSLNKTLRGPTIRAAIDAANGEPS